MKIQQIAAFVIAPAIFLYLIFLTPDFQVESSVKAMLAIAMLMAIWWITEVVPLAVTSLLPVVLFPLFGVMDGKAVAGTYYNDVIFLFMGGFFVALAMERWELHKRIALRILLLTGTKPSSILFGFMAASFLLSMWISNTATVMMLLPITLAIITQLEHDNNARSTQLLSIGLLLGIAYAASIGGVATLVGTPPNLSFVRIYHIYFSESAEVTFAQWFIFALPLSLLLFLSAWIILRWMFIPGGGAGHRIDHAIFRHELERLGKPSYEERIVLVAFIVLAFLWIFRSDILLGNVTVPGWSRIFTSGKFLNDGTVAIFVAMILFLIPSKNHKGETILSWTTASRIPWHILLLFGGGFALATGFKESGLSDWFGMQLSFVGQMHPLLVIGIIALLITFLTELTSNTATTEMVLPILAGLAVQNNLHPLLLMVPATISASMAFMLPVATPPNAIIFGTNRVRVVQMAKTGLILNLVGAAITTLVTYLWGGYAFAFR